MVTSPRRSDGVNQADRTWGGALVTVGLILFIGGVLVHLVGQGADGPPEGGTAEQVAAHNAAQPRLHELTSYSRAVGLVAAGLGSLLLSMSTGDRSMAGRPGWLAAGVGAVVFSTVVMVRATALVPLAQDFTANPQLFESWSRALTGLFGLFALTMMVGFGLALVAEARRSAPRARRVACWVGAAGFLGAATEPVGVLSGLALAGPWTGVGLLIGVLSVIWLGAAIALTDLRSRKRLSAADAPA